MLHGVPPKPFRLLKYGYILSHGASMILLRFLHLFTFIFWYGTLLYFTLVQAPLLFKSLPRQLFGEVQSHLFPAYYLISYICGTLLVVTYHLLHPLKSYSGAGPCCNPR